MIDRNAVLVGAVFELALLVTAGGIATEVFESLPWLGAVGLSSIGLFGGGVAGGLVGGPRRIRAAHGGLCSVFGGCIFGIWLWYALVADVYLGAFYGIAYAVATVGLPPTLVAQYDAVLPVALAVGAVVLYAIEGVLAGAVVPPEWIEPPPFYPS